MLQFDIYTLFPEMFAGPLTESMLKRAQENQIVSINLIDIRDYATDKHHTADGTPYGGGGGMILKPDPVATAIEATLPTSEAIPVILLSPQGRVFDQKIAQELSQYPRLALICGHYEGIDERVRELVITDELSIGDYVLTGGELAAMVVVDAVTRLLPGALGDPTGPVDDSHATGLLEYPHYTRPPEFRGLEVPEILLSGHEAKVKAWRREQSLRRTWDRRPDLLLTADLTDADREILLMLAKEEIEKRSGDSL
ncbi:MAG: tRNA (guanosine(37)-N1)-methyltransferase TrmD [Anaerolineae bacterium]|nr:tRNA (guanosine(37)-N1)-methyltransferase TrmD [Anaerolineae bacterium]